MMYQGYQYFCNYAKDPKVLKVIVGVNLQFTSYERITDESYTYRRSLPSCRYLALT